MGRPAVGPRRRPGPARPPLTPRRSRSQPERVRSIHTKETPMTITDNPVDNGVNVAALLGAREALSATPEAAEFTWRASCTWRNGTHSHSTVAGFTGLGAEQQHRSTYEYDIDHPECFASEDN